MFESVRWTIASVGIAVTAALALGCGGVQRSAHAAKATSCSDHSPTSTPSSTSGANNVTTPPKPKPSIVQTGDPVLRARAVEVTPEQIASPEFQALITRMIATM